METVDTIWMASIFMQHDLLELIAPSYEACKNVIGNYVQMYQVTGAVCVEVPSR